KIQNKFYVPIENSGIKFISETEYNILATSGSTASRNTGAHPAEPEMVFVKGGSFLMGCTSEQDNCDEDERPAHHVTVSDFYIGKYEVTQAQWEQLMGTNIRQQRDKFQRRANIFGEGSNYPMYYVSWDEAQMFIERLNAATGKRYRLPTEAEWEYAARGGNKSKGYKYAGSNSLENVAWFYDNSGRSTHPIGTKMANELGIYDMSGNVREWCYDWYGLYSSNSQTNPTGAGSGSSRVSRGGGLFHNAQKCRVACRDKLPSIRYDNLGFRLVLSSEQKESATSGSTGMAQGQVFEFEVPNKNNLVMIMAEARHVFQFDFNDNKLIHKHIAFPSDSKIIDTLDTFTIFAIAPRNETTPVFSISFGIQKGTNKYSCLFFDTLQVTDKMPAFMGIFPFNSQGNNIDFDNGNEYHLGSDDYKFINAEQFKKLQEYVDKRKQSKSQSTTPTSSTAPSATSKPQSSAASSASYLTTDGTNFTFDSDGINGLPITVSTDGSSWEVSLLPSWCSVKDKTGNSFRLVVNPNSGAARSDWFKVKSGNKEVRIEVKQTAGKQTTGTKGTSAQIENIWVDHNFSCGYNRKCLKIHIKFTVNGMLHKQGHCNAYFSFQNGNKLIDSNRQYRATDGQVSVGESFKPSHESAVFNDFALVIPHDEFHLGRGSYYLKFYVCIFDNNGNQIATSNYVDFTYNY
ncbi:MAG: SUMF1/EgtB/PvdO family nonheme iron enzyme, partial [Prevotellaceae bacterium]|nr:SUMF1/EgtB/PvdO family nonheme iron enzyme [Prevotellaceae bacterium]